jgi:hypothetical protein
MRLARLTGIAASLILALTTSGCGSSSTGAGAGCTSPATCPAASGPCVAPTCVSSQCGEAPKAVGTFVSDPTAGDCKSNQCNGAGQVVSANDDSDHPSATSDCFTPSCSAGSPVQTAKPAGAACSSNGGLECDGAGTCVQCLLGSECASGVCTLGACQVASCADGVKNGTETDVDCGGICAPCPDGRACLVGADCTSLTCTGQTCRAPTCNDQVRNGTETDVDCGGGACPACAAGRVCAVNGDCASGACKTGVCASPQGATCLLNAACANGNCVDGVCCDTSCAGTCQQCSASGTVGTCTNVPAGQDPALECGAGHCNGAGACTP